jgi:hypothetical protein
MKHNVKGDFTFFKKFYNREVMSVPINIRVDELLKDLVQQEADKELRNVSNFVANCIVTYLKDHKGIDYFQLRQESRKKPKE